MTGRAERLAQNETIFRAANEGINETVGGRASFMTFLCECGDASCMTEIRLTAAEYEEVRADPRRFALERGHEGPGEVVVSPRERFNMVEKVDAPGEIAEDRDARPSA